MSLEKSFTVIGGLKALHRFLSHLAMVYPSFKKGKHQGVLIIVADALRDFLRTTTPATEEEQEKFVAYFIQGIYNTLDAEEEETTQTD